MAAIDLTQYEIEYLELLETEAQDRARDSLAEFVKYFWSVLEPGRLLEWNWHIDVICSALERVTRRECLRLVICIPPGHMKSLLVSVFWPAWEWLHHPERRKQFFSNDDKLVLRDSRKTRYILTDERYMQMVDWRLKNDQNEKANFENTMSGFRECMSINANVTGKRADDQIVDDPYDVKQLMAHPEVVKKRMEEVLTIWDETLESRLNDQRTGARVIIMQRIHENDLAGVCIGRGYESVVLPAEYDPDMRHPHNKDIVMTHPEDPRTAKGELLFAKMFSKEFIEKLKPNVRASQQNQLPVAAEGGLFKGKWFREYNEDPYDIRAKAGYVIISIDCSFKDLSTSDYVAIGAWARIGPDMYLLDQDRAQMDFSATKAAAEKMRKKWMSRHVLIEEAANGHALIQVMKKEVPGIIGFKPNASKYARAQLASDFFESGNVLIPSDRYALFNVDAYKAELLVFPNGLNDDQVDQTSQAVIRMAGRPALKNTEVTELQI